MSGAPLPAENVGGLPPVVTEETYLLFDCPKCEQSLDITRFQSGTPIKCPSCENVTWSPGRPHKWWQKARGLFITNLIAFCIGVGSSITAGTYLEKNRNKQQSDSFVGEVHEDKNKVQDGGCNPPNI